MTRGYGIGVGNSPQRDGGASYCRCPSCGSQVQHVYGNPCRQTHCPKCGSMMVGA